METMIHEKGWIISFFYFCGIQRVILLFFLLLKKVFFFLGFPYLENGNQHCNYEAINRANKQLVLLGTTVSNKGRTYSSWYSSEYDWNSIDGIEYPKFLHWL